MTGFEIFHFLINVLNLPTLNGVKFSFLTNRPSASRCLSGSKMCGSGNNFESQIVEAKSDCT